MSNPTPLGPDPQAMFSSFNGFSGDYPPDYTTLFDRAADDDALVDFSAFVRLFVGYVFNGGGAKLGLTEVCCSLAQNLCDEITNQNKHSVEIWRWRLCHLRNALLDLGVPPLPPLNELTSFCVEHVCRVNESDEQERSAQRLDRLIQSWHASPESRLSEAIVDCQNVLLVGHSTVITETIRQAREELGTSFNVFCYCPSPVAPNGRPPCYDCPYAADSRLYRRQALEMISEGKIDMVLVAVCAYHHSRTRVWVTRHARDIALAAMQAMVPCYPVAGYHKELTRTPIPDRVLRPSEYVDLLTLDEVHFLSRYLR